MSNPRELDQDYENSADAPIRIEFLAQANDDGTWESFSDKSRAKEAMKQLGIDGVDVFEIREKAA